MTALYIISGIVLSFSLVASKEKTIKALKIAWKKFYNMLPQFLLMIILVSISLFFIPNTVIAKYLGGKNLYLSALSASIFGSVAVMPGFIAFPLGGLLVKKGVSYTVIAAFTSTLMLVGVLSYPLEKKFLGTRITITRNIISYFVTLVIAIFVGLFYGEINV